jgi:beta-galactosidase
MVRRDRNHPSVFFWSIGNEIPGCFTRPDIASRLRQKTLALDETRMITAGICSSWWPEEGWVDWPTSSDVAFESLDVGGINYLIPHVEDDHARNPQRVMMHTETFPLSTKDAWKQVTELPYVIGDFVWTCFDYLGESGIGMAHSAPDQPRRGNYPLHVAVCGDFDLAGFAQPQAQAKEALWKEGFLSLAAGPSPEARGWPRQTETFHHNWNWNLVETHWNWPGWEGKIVQVDIYSSCESVELFVNGTSVGSWDTSTLENRWTTVEIPYQPGELKAVGRFRGEEVVSRLVTTGAPVRVSARLEGTFGGLHFVEAVMVDHSGAVVQVEDKALTLTVGDGLKVLAFGNGSPVDIDSVTDLHHRTHKGRALAVLSGVGSLALDCEGLAGASLEIS